MDNTFSVSGFFSFIPGGDTLSISLLYFIGSAVLAFLVSPLFIKLLYKLKIVRRSKEDRASNFDKANNKIGTPVMGGIVFIFTIVLITFLFNWKRDYTWVPIGSLILSSCIGGIDDLLGVFGKSRKYPLPVRVHLKLISVHKRISKRLFYVFTLPINIFENIFVRLGSKPSFGLLAYEKLFLQLIVGFVVGFWIHYKLGWTYLWLPSFMLNQSWFLALLNYFNVEVLLEYSSINIGILMIPVIMFLIILISNAVNISDGMDGLAGGLSLIAFASYAVIAFGISEFGKVMGNTPMYGTRSVMYLCATAAGSLLAYLYFNVKPARVQMGDIGSLSIGTLISVVAILLNREITLFLICGVFFINGALSRLLQLMSKLLFRRKIFLMIPLHYHFALLNWPEEKIVTRFWIASVLMSAIGIWVAGV